MEHLLLKAATTATDQGTFEAVISTSSVDRDGDIVEPSALVAALQKWVDVGKLVPLAWAHQEAVVGHVDPVTAKVVDNEVVVKGWIDQSTDLGKETWRLVKSGTLSFSYGFLVPEGGATKRAGVDRGNHITQLDLFEISVVPIAPANNETRVLSFKSLEGEPHEALRTLAAEIEAGAITSADITTRLLNEAADAVEKTLSKDTTQEPVEKDVPEPSEQAHRSDPLRKRADAIALEFASGGIPKPPRQVEQPKPEPELSLRELKQRTRDEILMHLSGETL
jgi:HK97 family phage prohead protease